MDHYYIFKTLMLSNLVLFIYSMVVIGLISYLLYFKRGGKPQYLFTNLLVGVIVFQICLVLKNIPLNLGFALGLFAVFGIIRYRTTPILPREMTYLFIAIGIAATNGLLAGKGPFYVFIIWDSAIFLAAALGELFLSKNRTQTKKVVYEKLNLIEEGKEEELEADLKKRLAISEIISIKVGDVNFLRDTAEIFITFKDDKHRNF
jgi:hypothetical protein